MSRQFDRSKFYVEGASEAATAEEQQRAQLCEDYIKSASWADETPTATRSLVATNVRGAWPVAFTQGWNARQPEIDALQAEKEALAARVERMREAVEVTLPGALDFLREATNSPADWGEWTRRDVEDFLANIDSESSR